MFSPHKEAEREPFVSEEVRQFRDAVRDLTDATENIRNMKVHVRIDADGADPANSNFVLDTL